jgi:3-hydroxyisobutyrate dehydrogenase-like beta-hydroxyacid dehydrogenase
MSPGDMGSGVGGVLGRSGLRVITSLKGRSEASSTRAAEEGIVDVGSLDDVVASSDLILSILVPSEALAFAASAAESIVRTNRHVAFADCNAVSPATGVKIGKIITASGGMFIDAGIIGGSPRTGAIPRFYASGEHAGILAELDGKGMSVPVMRGAIGRASGLKMLCAALTNQMHGLSHLSSPVQTYLSRQVQPKFLHVHPKRKNEVLHQFWEIPL